MGAEGLYPLHLPALDLHPRQCPVRVRLAEAHPGHAAIPSLAPRNRERGDRREFRRDLPLAGPAVRHLSSARPFEELTLRRLTLFDTNLRSYRGRLVKTMGDGLLVEFGSALDAVNCAIALQEANQVLDASRPAERRLVLRIGISLSDVMRDRDDIYGTGVNIAARLQSIAEPNGVAISAAVLEQLRGKITREAKAPGT